MVARPGAVTLLCDNFIALQGQASVNQAAVHGPLPTPSPADPRSAGLELGPRTVVESRP